MSVAQKLAANTVAQVVGKTVSIGIGLIVVGVLTRLLGVEGFGKYSTANAFLGVFAILMDLGTNVLLVQMLGEHKGDTTKERHIVSAFFTLRVITSAIALSLAVAVAWLIPSYDVDVKLAIMALWASYFFSVLGQIVTGVHQQHLNTRMVAIAEVAGRLVLLAGVLVAFWNQWGLVPVVLIVSVGGIVNFAVSFWAAQKRTPIRWCVDVAFWKTVVQRAWPISISILASLIYFRADMLMLGWVRPQHEVGIYSAAYRVLDILVTLPFLYAGVILPLLANAWKYSRKPEFHALLQHSLNAMLLVTIPLVVGTQAVAAPVMTLIGGSDFAASGGVLQILIMATGAIFIATIFSHAVIALDAQKDMLPWYLWTALGSVTGYILFIPTYGLWAAAWLTLISEAVICVGNIIVVAQRSNAPLNWRVAGKALLAAIGMFAVVSALVPYNWPAAIVLGIIVYSGLILALRAVTPEEIHALFPQSTAGTPSSSV